MCYHQADQVSSAHRLLHFLLLLCNQMFVATTMAGEEVGRHHHRDVPQRHSILVLVRDHVPQEDQQSLKADRKQGYTLSGCDIIQKEVTLLCHHRAP